MSMTSLDGIKSALADMLKGIERYNPDNIATLERYVDVQAKEIGYDLEANLALLKLYQFNHGLQNISYVGKILLKAITNLPHSDYIVCKSLLSQEVLNDPNIKNIQVINHKVIKEIILREKSRLYSRANSKKSYSSKKLSIGD